MSLVWAVLTGVAQSGGKVGCLGGQAVMVVSNRRQWGVVMGSTGPSGFFESRTRTPAGVDATSTQLPFPAL